MIPPPRHLTAAILSAAVLVTGCSHPSVVNNQLRDENQKLRDQVADLDRRHVGDQATIQALEQKQGTPPELSASKVNQLFTVHGIKLGRLTGGDDWDSSHPGQDGLRVAVEPTDDHGDKIKASGSIDIDAFDLASGGENRIGHWSFDLAQTRESWNGGGLLYAYILKCPWQRPPTHSEVTLRVAFTDALTGRQFTQQKSVKVEVPTATATTQGVRPS